MKDRWNQLAVFLFIVGVNMVLFAYIASGTARLFFHTASLDSPEIARYINIVVGIGAFGISTLLYAFFVNSGKPFIYLKMNKGIKWENILLILLILCAYMPALSWIIEWNEGLHLPQAFASIEQWMRTKEDASAILTQQMLLGNSLPVLFANLLAMAIVPAICEELVFRGVLLSWLKNSFHKKHLAVWLSAIVFSAIHIQFFGFFPRLLLGVYLGYLFLWTGSLWSCILAHFLHNAIVVVAAFLHNIGYIAGDYQQLGNGGGNPWIIVISFCITTALIWCLWKNKEKKNENGVGNDS